MQITTPRLGATCGISNPGGGYKDTIKHCMSATKIYEYIQGNRFSQARSILSEELEKSPGNAIFLSLDALLSFRLNNRREAVDSCTKAIDSKQITATSVNSLLAPVLLAYNESQLLSSAFEVVNRKFPSDTQLVSTWIECALILGDVRVLCKALIANNRQKSTRKSLYQTCFAMYLVWAMSGPDETERKLYPQLVARMLEKFLPSKSLQEAYVEAMALKMQNPEKMSQFLMKQQHYQSLDLDCALLDALIENKDWKNLEQVCLSSLERMDSYQYWLGLNQAANKLGHQKKVREFAKKFKGNNVLLALINLDENDSAKTLENLKTYWNQMSTKVCAFEYLQKHISNEAFVNFLNAQAPTNFSALVNKVKLMYLVNSDIDQRKLIELYDSHLDELPAENTDYFIGSDLLMIVALEILKSKQPYSLLKASMVLEKACHNDPANFYVRLWLIKIFRALGAFSKANAHYKKLAVKNLQHESLSHIVGTRSGTTMPDRDFCIETMSVYEQSENMFASTNMALDSEVFTQLAGMLDLQRRLNCSLTRALMGIESLKTERLKRGSTKLSQVVCIPACPLADNRDFKTRFDPRDEMDYRPDLGIELGPRPNQAWIRLQVERERVVLQALRGAPVAVEVTGAELDCLTKAERWSYDMALRVASGNFDLLPIPKVEPHDFSWEYFHNAYTILETFKILCDISNRNRIRLPKSYEDLCKHLEDVFNISLPAQNKYATEVSVECEQWASDVGIKDASLTVSGIFNSRAQSITQLRSIAKSLCT